MSPQPLSSRRLNRCPRAGISGFTLIELLVCMSLLILIGLVLIGITGQSSALVAHGASVISLHQKSRSAMQRIAPLLATAVTTPGHKSVEIPALKSNDPVNPPYDFRIRFNTTEDFLRQTPPYDPREVFDPASVPVYLYEIEFVKDTPSNPKSLGKLEFHKLNLNTKTVDTSLPARVLAHKIQQFRTLLINSNTLEVIVDTSGTRKGPQGNLIEVVETERSVISIPSESYQ